MRKLVADGRLAARKDGDGAYLFERSSLLALPRVVRAPEGLANEEQSAARHEATPEVALESGPLAKTPDTAATVLDGMLAAKLFEAFEASQSVVSVVVSTKVAPAIVEEAYATWRRLKGADATAPATRLDALDTALNELSAAVGHLQELVDGMAGSLTEESTSTWRLGQSVGQIWNRLVALERTRRF